MSAVYVRRVLGTACSEEQRGKRAHTLVVWKGALKVWRKPEVTLGGVDRNHGEQLKPGPAFAEV